MPEVPSVAAGDEVQLRKPHACGANRWIVMRTGADLRLQCAGCGHTVLMPRHQFNRAVCKVVKQAIAGGDHPAAGPGTT